MKKFIKNIVMIVSLFVFTMPFIACDKGNEFVTVNANLSNVKEYLQSVSNGEILLDNAHYGELSLGLNKKVAETEGDGNRTPYCGVWNIENLTISGTKDAIVDGFSIDINTKNINGVFYQPTYNVKTLKIKGITMYGPMQFGYDNENHGKVDKQIVENLIIEDVTFDFSELASNLEKPSTNYKIESAIWFIPKNDNIKNLVVKNCTFTNMNDVRAVILFNAIRNGYPNQTNITIENCTFDSAGYNHIQFGGSTGHTGSLTIKNNNFSGSNNVCVRITSHRGIIDISSNIFNKPVSNNYAVYVDYSEMARITMASDNQLNGTTTSGC